MTLPALDIHSMAETLPNWSLDQEWHSDWMGWEMFKYVVTDPQMNF